MTGIVSFGAVGYGDIPVVETPRLRLRAYRLDDLDALSEMWADPEVTRFIGGEPRSRAQVWQQIQRNTGSWAMLGFGYWVVEDIATGACVGEIGFMEGLRDIEPQFVGTPEAGWVIAPSWAGRGYASEGLSAALAWRDAHIASARTVCIIEPEHKVSIHIAHKHGFRKLVDTQIAGEPIGLFERMR